MIELELVARCGSAEAVLTATGRWGAGIGRREQTRSDVSSIAFRGSGGASWGVAVGKENGRLLVEPLVLCRVRRRWSFAL